MCSFSSSLDMMQVKSKHARLGSTSERMEGWGKILWTATVTSGLIRQEMVECLTGKID